MAIARNDDEEEEEEEEEEISNRTVDKKKKKKSRSSTRYSVMRPSERDEGRRQLREETLPFISSRAIIQTRRTRTSTSSKINNTSNPVHKSEKQELKHDDSLASIELTALMKMWKG